MRHVKIAATQMRCTSDLHTNIKTAESIVREAAAQGAQIILLQELFETLYFCQKENPNYYQIASTVESNIAINHFKTIARELSVVLPISFYERKNNALFNSIVVIDADGSISDTYRKSHIPDGPGYEEKYYFSPGDTGFKVFETKYAKIGVGICWDQWFPEAARAMVLMGAELLFYPTAIGSEPESPEIDSKDHWQRCMIGHAACNLVPVIASNRIGEETIENSTITFYGSSFIAGTTGEIIKEADRSTQTVITVDFDLDKLVEQRLEWGLFRDRRPELYEILSSLDGTI
ncbi:N-carbamoylputrescine amidase [Eubacteriaceae bacterium ES3]|nr:N-carbamoylputrescine amidase [Eubacteriaceae bacterium ES3]